MQVIADGSDVGGRQGPGHRSFYVDCDMSYEDFLAQLRVLGWEGPFGRL
jgi:hypothetical protein